MSERKQINTKIKKQKAEKWEEYQQNNPEYSSMTDLVRQSVEKEIAGNSDSPTGSTSSEVGMDIAEMKDNMNQLQNQVRRLTTTVSDLEGKLKSKPSDKHLRSEIFAALPVSEYEGFKDPHKIAEELGDPVDATVVADVLEDMVEDVGVVEKYIGKDLIKYAKEE